MSPGLILLLLAATLAVLLAGFWTYEQGRAQRAEAERRSRLLRGEPATRRLRAALDAGLRRTPFGRNLESRLRAAGMDVGASEALLVALGLAAITFGVTSLAVSPLVALICAFLVLLACRGYVQQRRRQRTEAFVAQLPELARILSNASSAGLALPSAIAMTASEMEEPASEVMQRVVEELQLGQAIDAALENLADRMPSREVGVLVSSLVIQQRAGGDVVAALRDMADTLEARKDLRREVRTVMAGAIFTSYLVAGLGLGSLLLLNAISPGVLEEMTESWIGRAALAVGLGLYALGFLLVRRTTRIET